MTGEFGIAVHALVCLAHRGESLTSEVLAGSICTNPARVRKVMAKLRKAGLVETKEGMDGGYRFVLDPRRVTLAQVARALETVYVSTSWSGGKIDRDCLVASGMAGVLDELCGEMNRRCEAYLEECTVADIHETIFGHY